MRQMAYISPKGRGRIVLVLDRRVGQGVLIESGIKVRVLGIKNKRVRLGIEAPIELSIRLEDGDSPIPRKANKEVKVTLKKKGGFGICDRIFVKVLYIGGRRVKLAIKAPPEIEILRDELKGAPKKEEEGD